MKNLWLKIQKISLSVICLIFLPSVSHFAYAGDRIGLELHVGKAGHIGSVHTRQYSFPEQWNIGIGCSYQIKYIELCGGIAYHHLTYNSHVEGFPPAYIIVSDEADGPGRMYEISGIFRFLITIESTFQPYLFFQAGHYWISFPGNTIKTLENSVLHTYNDPADKETTPFYGGGIGFRISNKKNVAFGPEIYVLSGEELYLGLNFTIQLKI
jgi:hypothetical protein